MDQSASSTTRAASHLEYSLEEYATLLGLSLDEVKNLHVVDSHKNIIMVHPRDDINYVNTRVTSHRGTVIDTVKKCIVCHGKRLPLPIVMSSIPSDDQSMFTFVDEFSTTHKMIKSKCEITPFFDPVYLRAFMWDGVFYVCTLKKLDPRTARSRWYDFSPTFMELYDEAGGPTKEQLYQDGVRYSPYVYNFSLICGVLNLSNLSTPSDAKYVRFDSVESMWGLDSGIFTESEIGIINQVAVDPTSVSSAVKSKAFTLDQANRFLASGNPEGEAVATCDTALGLGESVFVTELDDDGKIIDVVHVLSPQKKRRENIFNRNPNIYQGFILNLGAALVDPKRESKRFISAVVPLDVSGIEGNLSAITKYDLSNVTCISEEQLKNYTPAQLQLCVWLYIYVTTSDYYKPYIQGCMDRYNKDMEDLYKWICSMINISPLIYPGKSGVASRRVINILGVAKEDAKRKNKKGQNITVTIQQNIHKMLQKERKDTLYTMIADMRYATHTSSTYLTDRRHTYDEANSKPRPSTVTFGPLMSAPVTPGRVSLKKLNFPELNTSPSLPPLMPLGSLGTSTGVTLGPVVTTPTLVTPVALTPTLVTPTTPAPTPTPTPTPAVSKKITWSSLLQMSEESK